MVKGITVTVGRCDNCCELVAGGERENGGNNGGSNGDRDSSDRNNGGSNGDRDGGDRNNGWNGGGNNGGNNGWDNGQSRNYDNRGGYSYNGRYARMAILLLPVHSQLSELSGAQLPRVPEGACCLWATAVKYLFRTPPQQ